MLKEKVLIVEDDAIIAMRLQDTLESWGYGTGVTSSGEKAIEWVKETQPDLVLMDIRLDGGIDGIQAAEKIRSMMGPPTIFLTAYSDEELIERAKLTEPYGYLVKPVHERELRSTIEMALFKHKMDRKLLERERQFRAIFKQAGVGVALVESTSGQILQINQKFCKIIGYQPEEVEQKITHFQITHPEDCKREQALLDELWLGKFHEFSIEKRYLRRDQSEIWVNQTVSAMWEAGEDPTMHIIVAEDITPRKQAEENLRRRVAELEAVNRISGALRSAQQLSQVLPVLLDEILTILEVEAGAIALRQPMTEKTDLVEARGWLKDSHWFFADSDKGIFQLSLASPGKFVSQDFSLDARIHDDIRSRLPANWGGVILPLHAGNEALGLVVVSVPQPRCLSEFETGLLETVAQIAGNTFHRLRLFEQTQRSLQRIESLHEIDTIIRSNLDLKVTLGIILEHVVQQLNVDAANVLLTDVNSPYLRLAAQRGFFGWTGETIQARAGEGIAGRAAITRQITKGSGKDFELEPRERARLFRDEQFQSSYSLPLLSKGKVAGVLEVFKRGELEPDKEWLGFLGNLAGQVALAVEDLSLLENLHRSNAELVLAYDETIEGWSRAMDLRDRETEGHTRRVTEMTVTLAQTMGLPDETILQYRRGALLHDIGKIGVPDSILHKPGPLTGEEWVIMRTHPQLAFDLLAPISYLQPALDIPFSHHEKWDGTGYPRGLKAEQIPLAARLFAVVDVYDALTSDRPYRKAWTVEKTLQYIIEQSGKHFEPKVVEIFLKVYGE